MKTGSAARLTKHECRSQEDPVWTLNRSAISWNTLGKLFILSGLEDPPHESGGTSYFVGLLRKFGERTYKVSNMVPSMLNKEWLLSAEVAGVFHLLGTPLSSMYSDCKVSRRPTRSVLEEAGRSSYLNIPTCSSPCQREIYKVRWADCKDSSESSSCLQSQHIIGVRIYWEYTLGQALHEDLFKHEVDAKLIFNTTYVVILTIASILQIMQLFIKRVGSPWVDSELDPGSLTAQPPFLALLLCCLNIQLKDTAKPSPGPTWQGGYLDWADEFNRQHKWSAWFPHAASIRDVSILYARDSQPL